MESIPTTNQKSSKKLDFSGKFDEWPQLDR